MNFKKYLLLVLALSSVACSLMKHKEVYSDADNAISADNLKLSNFKAEDDYPIPNIGKATSEKQGDNKKSEDLLLPPRSSI